VPGGGEEHLATASRWRVFFSPGRTMNFERSAIRFLIEGPVNGLFKTLRSGLSLRQVESDFQYQYHERGASQEISLIKNKNR
jgi:hypothetical protein